MNLDEQELNLEGQVRDFKMNENYPSIDKIKKRIEDIELAITHTKKTTRIHQNRKNLHKAQQNLRYTIYQYNKFDLFNLVGKLADIKLSKGLDDYLNSFASVNDISLGDSATFQLGDSYE